MAHNLEQCVKLVGKAAAAGAKVLFLPEASDYIASSGEESLSLAQPMSTSPFVTGLQSAAAAHSLAIHVGIHEPVLPLDKSQRVVPSPPSKLLNRTIFITAQGEIPPHGIYDKIHLFDYGALRESANTQAGRAILPPFASPVGRLGSLICFDLRFAEPAIHLATNPAFAREPAQTLLYPSAFTVPTGAAHWELLLRARAVETQSWVVAAAQVGRHAGPGGRRVSYGRSMVVDPWGRVVLALRGVREGKKGEEGGEGDWEAEEGAVGELGVVEIDLGEWERVRERMPLVRRTDIYPAV
ncbi:carbon-nitrogen hydrolase [Whalleya microplaca]|nr:carbon-nitrogen hydrolase [Whalleya microplaca]